MKITWFPAGARTFASSRLRVWKIADAIRQIGGHIAEVHNTHQWADTDLADVIVVQKRLDLTEQMNAWVQQGKRVIWDVDDWMPYPDLPDGAQVTVDTRAKLELYPQAIVIPDALDIGDNPPQKSAHAEYLQKVVTVLNAENSYHIRNAAAACDKLGLELTVITDLNSAHYAHIYGVQGFQWDINTVDQELIQHDLFIAPYVFDGAWPEQWVKSKSPNRILKAWALGLPVAATPIPAYQDVGLTYVAQTVEEWVSVFTKLDDKNARIADDERGCDEAMKYEAKNVAEQWLKVFNG